MGYLSFFLRIFLGAILILSGFAKLSYPGSKALDPQMAETFSVFVFIPLDLIHLYVRLLPWIELVIACGLVLGLFLRFFSGAAILMIMSFIIANCMFAYYGYLDHCAKCFGELLALKLPHAIALDLLMLAMAVWIFWKGDMGISLDSWRRRKVTQGFQG